MVDGARRCGVEPSHRTDARHQPQRRCGAGASARSAREPASADRDRAAHDRCHRPPICVPANVSSLLGGGSSGSGDTGGADGGNGSSSISSSTAGGLNLYVVGFDASWELDFFGGNRRAIEGAKASVDASEARVADAIVTLTAEVAQSYIALCDARQPPDPDSSRDVDIDSHLLDLMKARRAGGTATRPRCRAGVEPAGHHPRIAPCHPGPRSSSS